jgi:hypothetical protein
MRWVGFLLLLTACHGAKHTANDPHHVDGVGGVRRAHTAGDDLLSLLPAGADGVLEIDLARLRANAVVGALVPMLPPVPDQNHLGYDPLRELDVVVLAVYGVGRDDAQTLTLVRGEAFDASKAQHATALDAHTAVYAPDALVARVKSGESSVSGDLGFLALRDTAMPERAEGASIRLTARLSKDARITAAGKLGLDAMPATISLWMDVADDLAIIAFLQADDTDMAKRLAQAVLDARDKVGRMADARWELDPVLAKLEAIPEHEMVKLRWVIGPRALKALVERAGEELGRSSRIPPPVVPTTQGSP